MEAFGFFYVIAFFIDANISIVATLFSKLDPLSSMVSMVILGLSTPVLVLSIAGKLRPRKTYLLLAIYYWASFFLVIALMAVLMPKMQLDGVTEANFTASFRNQFPWFLTVRWTFVLIGEILAIYGLTSIVARRKKLKAEAEVSS